MFENPQVKRVWNVVRVVKTTMGLTFGLYLFTYGAFFYEKFGGSVDPQNAIMLATILLALRQGLVAILEVPTSAIGDTIGRVNTVIWSLICRMFFFIGLAIMTLFSDITMSFAIGIVASIAFAFAYTFFSGTFTAWCVDSLREADSNMGYEHILSRGYTYEFITQIFAAVIAILSYHYDVVYLSFLLGAFICLACITYCRGEMEEVKTLKFIERKKANITDITKRMGEIIGIGFNVCRKTSAILWLLLIWAAFLFTLNIVDFLWPVFLKTRFLTSPQTVYWLITAVAVLLMNAGGSQSIAWFTSRWKKHNHMKTHNKTLRRRLVLAMLLSSLMIIALGLATSRSSSTLWLFAMAIFTIEFSYGFVAPCYETLVNNYIPDEYSQERSTIMSFGSMIKSTLVLLLAIPSGGKSGETTTVGWMIPAFLLLVIVVIGNQIIKQYQKKTEKEAEPAMGAADIAV